MERAIRKDFTPRSARLRHLVIGHSQIKNCWDYKYKEPELELKIDWICVPGGKAQELKELLISEIREAQIPLRISAMIWQNSITTITLSEVKEIVEEIESTLKLHPQHRVALPECQYVPAQADYFEHIAKVNLLLADFNKRHGFNRYSLFKSTMKDTKKGLRVKQDQWSEYQRKTGPGYHIADKTRYTEFIRKFHLNNLESSVQVAWKPSTLDITKVLAVLSPPNKMEDPSKGKRDLRESLTVNKELGISPPTESGRKRPKPTEEVDQESQKRPKMSEKSFVYDEDLTITFENVAVCPKTPTSVIPEGNHGKQTVPEEEQPDDDPKASTSKDKKTGFDMKSWSKWADLGKRKGYLKPVFKLIDKKVKEANEKLLKKLKKKVKKRKHMKRSDRNRKCKKKQGRKDQSSDSSTTSSSSSFDSSTSSDSSDE